MSRNTLVGSAIIVLSTARLTRLIVTDDLGEWLVRRPVNEWSGYDPWQGAETTREKIASGLDCPFCVGTWIGFGVLGSAVVTDRLARRGHRLPHEILSFVLTGLALNYVVGHVESRLSNSTAEV